MRVLTLLHRWTGGLIGLVLVVLGLSGALLLWKADWIGVPGAGDPLRPGTAALAAAVAAAERKGELARITFASEEFGLHQAIYTDGGGAYLNQNAAVVEQWSGRLGRPELWLFDLHHYLLAGAAGEIFVGSAGLVLVFFTLSGIVLWWRTRRTFALRALPARMTRSAIVRHHRDLGVVAAPLLLLSGTTGAMMIFPAMTDVLLSPWGATAPKFEAPAIAPAAAGASDWPAVFDSAARAFPGAMPRRLQLPGDAGKPALIRMRQDFEWTPNGRSYVYVDPASAAVVATVDPAGGGGAQAIQEKLYPLHSAAVGGPAWRTVLTLAGVALAMLGGFATWSFWFMKPKPARETVTPSPPPAGRIPAPRGIPSPPAPP